MIDKQIIIDGVDLGGRRIIKKHREGYCGWHTPCEGDTCPYKLKWALQQLKTKEQECEKAKKIIETAVDDFNLEYGTPQYDRLLNGAKSLGIEVKDYE